MDSRVYAWVVLGVLLVACAMTWGSVTVERAVLVGGDSDASLSALAVVSEERTVSGFRGWLTVFGIRLPNMMVPLLALLTLVAWTAPMPPGFRLHAWSAKGPALVCGLHAAQVAVVLHREGTVAWPLYLALGAVGALVFVVFHQRPHALRTVDR